MRATRRPLPRAIAVARFIAVPRAIAVTLVAATALVATALVAGCDAKPGSTTSTPTTPAATADTGPFAGKSADEVATAAVAALKAAPSVHLKGTFTENGAPMTVDLRFTSKHDGIGTISTGGESFQLMKIGNDLYFKGDDAFMKSIVGDDKDVAKLLKGKWLKGTASGQADMAGFFDISEEIFKDPPADLRKGETSTINGVTALALKSNGGPETLWVAVEGEPYPVRLDSGTEGTIDFTEYGAAIELKAPSKSEIFDISH